MIIALELGPASEVSADDRETMRLVRILVPSLCLSQSHRKLITHTCSQTVDEVPTIGPNQL